MFRISSYLPHNIYKIVSSRQYLSITLSCPSNVFCRSGFQAQMKRYRRECMVPFLNCVQRDIHGCTKKVDIFNVATQLNL